MVRLLQMAVKAALVPTPLDLMATQMCGSQLVIFRVRFEATQDAEWSVGGLRLDVVQRGGR